MFINDILSKNIFFQSLLCFSVFVLTCEENYSPGVGCTVNESLPEFRGRCDFKQYIPNKPSIWYVLFKVATSFIWSHLPLLGFFEDLQRSWNSYSKLPIPTQAVLDLVATFVGSNRNVTTVNYYTSIPLALGLRAPSLTLVGTLNLLMKNKGCIPPSFLAKANQGTVQFAFDCPNKLRLLSIAPKKNKRVVFLSTMHFKEEKDEETGKEEINAFYKS